MAQRRIGQILVDLGYVSDDQLELLLEEQHQRTGQLLGQVAQDMGLINDDQLAQALAEQLHLRVVTVTDLTIDPKVIAMVTEPMAQMYRIIPTEFDGNTLTVAMCDPQNLGVQDELRTFLGFNIRVVVATEPGILKALERYYGESTESVESIVTAMEEDSELAAAAAKVAGNSVDLTSVEALADSAPVRKLLNMVLLLAIKDHASDLHFEPFEDEFRIRIKADGVLYEMVPPPRHLAFAITTRIKVMANLDIAERRMPQDGRIELTVGGHPVDLRVSVLPTMFGESVVMRVLDRSVVSLDLRNVGLDEKTMGQFRVAISKPNGIVLVTGPTGSGKTTTLYSALNELNTIHDKLITTEDPVEYDMEGIIQVPIDASIGNTFAACLRAILRQDPDKILVGEIRDLETAEIAVQASLTGHMVFSTLHTNDAPSTITRLKDMGVPVFMISATVEAILAQRLVRRICTKCREEHSPTKEMLDDLELSPADLKGKRFFRGSGCENCNNTGYKGRVGLFELMILNNELREMIMQNASTDDLRQAARKSGMVTLRDAGMKACFEGTTTAEEVIRETIMEA
ncbi:MAG: Flp pilus assembly complex ATPase component TadA [Planctomycetaceae bacterium]|uniref:Type II/IV secretion system protein n=1 Tax=Lacipirellula limnantheis TaxID=2528024 RepID=A0A517TVZ4_9BACT|nr:ATPase, T2SS/T4P/T4SS family [Lacipirellula limnantheis]MBL9161868.1 Flp pilus assembly complex ATPase component TadA [Planctomycetaceae bacterium]QDT72541.1 Type II/IV secretion system protein [Lacipirellula limnantheis]